MKTQDALVMVFSRSIFYRRLYFLGLATFALALMVVGILIGVIYFLIKNPHPPLYFATDSIGRLIPIIPIDRPNMSNDEVTAWVTEAIQKTYSYDFVNFRTQMQTAQKYFTNYGWTNYMNALRLSNNLTALIERKQIVIAQVVPPVKITAQGLLGGAYAWKFETRVLLTYWEPPFDEKSKFVNPLDVSVIVQRQEILQSYRGLGIIQLIARLAETSNAPQEISETPGGG